MGYLDASAVGLAIVLALALALFLLKQEDSDEMCDDPASDRMSRNRGRGMWQ
jgi:hypothetical protein